MNISESPAGAQTQSFCSGDRVAALSSTQTARGKELRSFIIHSYFSVEHEKVKKVSELPLSVAIANAGEKLYREAAVMRQLKYV